MARSAPHSKKLEPFGTSIFTEMSDLARRSGAVNLSQGFPDFPGPEWVKEAACRAIRADANQYAPSTGVPALRKAISSKMRGLYGLEFDPDSEVTVTTGATEAIHSAFLGLLDPGDEVVAFEPFYDSYPACAAMASAGFRCVPLVPPRFEFDPGELARAISPRTKLLVVNTPHNPTGKVFSRGELETIAELALERDLLVLTDEVYEHITFEGARHLPLAAFPGMRDRTITISSTAKTFSLTGWKIGWALAAPALSDAVRKAHQFVTFCTATPFQEAMAEAIREAEEYYARLAAEYAERRAALLEVLGGAGFEVRPPQGTYFAMADYRPLGFSGDDLEFCRYLATEVGVAAIPPSSFYHHPEFGKGFVRFSFCKRLETIRAAGQRLAALSRLEAHRR